MEEIKSNIFVEFGRSSKTAFGEKIVFEDLLKGKRTGVPKILLEETTILDRKKMLGLREASPNYPIDYISARSLAWIEASKWLPSVLKRIHENDLISPFNEKH